MSKELKIINTDKWIQENKSSFLPPVCNKLMHNEQLIIMFVGGPNQREDYHIEEGEELFYQIKGDMCVKIIENGKHKDIYIKEGEFFLLPGKIPHSPQRTADSIGLVIERRRLTDEKDGVRWFVPNSTDVLYEKWFHCKDLGVELIPLIKNYFASDEYKTKLPGNNILDKSEYPFELNNCLIKNDKHGPYNFDQKINSSFEGLLNLTPEDLNLQFEVNVLSKGTHMMKSFFDNELDLWLWQLNGISSILLICLNNNESSKELKLNKFDSILVKYSNYKEISIKIEDNESKLLVISQNPKKK